MKILLVAGASVAATAVALAATATGQTTPVSPVVYLQKDTHFKFVDLPPKGGERRPPSIGDEYVIGGSLTLGGRSAGASSISCVVAQPGAKGRSTCTGALDLAGGTITIGGISRLATDSDTFAITGGTGTYAGASGTIDTSDASGGRTRVAVRLG